MKGAPLLFVRKGRQRGISLLEIMITIVLLTTVLITFAAVYPSGYKLNRKTARASQAAKAATAVAEEVQALPFTSIDPAAATLVGLAGNTWNNGNAGNYETGGFYPQRHIEDPFFLEDNTAIVVNVHNVNGFPVAATISVTVGYREVGGTRYTTAQPGAPAAEIQRVTVTTAKTVNR